MMKKVLAGILLLGMALCILAGCGGEPKAEDSPSPGSTAEESVAAGNGEATADAAESSGTESAGGQENPSTETVYEEDGSFYTLEYHYDERGNVAQADCYRQDGSFWYHRDYEYDEQGNRTKQSTDGVVDFRMEYDGAGRIAFEVDYDENGHLQRFWEFTYGENGDFTESHIDFQYCEGLGYDGGDLAYGTRGGIPTVDVYFYPDGEAQRIVWYDGNGKYAPDRDTFYKPEDTPSPFAE